MFYKVLFAFTAFAVGLCLFLSHAEAQTSRIYFAGYLGLNTFKDLDFSESTVPTGGDIELKNAPSFAGALGIRLSKNVRLEGEVFYSKADFDRVDFNNAGSFEMGGELTSFLTLLNVYYDFDVPWAVQPFVGAGLGFGWHDGEIDDRSGLAVDVSDDTTDIAWQLGGGLRYRVSPDVAFTSSYRYLDSADLDFGSYSLDFGSHEFRIGLEYDIPVSSK